ncbi:uncharacterized protein LOC134258915 [Saccostrea cucullata]|uniref:uncharacterized protein LOC134258915 n=1 Tax=Saccostrea cuccullata TaxID=36930 RepID=UPI002ED1312D
MFIKEYKIYVYILCYDTFLGIKDKPSQIFNVDETGFGKCEKREKVVTEKVRKHTYARSVSSTSHITATICVAANGLVLPTFLIYENSFPSGSYRDGAPRDWLFGTSPNGYMDGDLFYKWFETVFLPNCSKRPSLLILDNHESHITLKLIQRAKAEEVELYGLPPHTTHVTQPLDVALFKPMKTKFSDTAVNLVYARKDLVIGKAKFAPVLSSAIDQTFSPHHIKEAFRKTGIYPFNPQVISQMQLAPADKHQVSHHDEVHDDQTSCAPPALCHACGHFVQQNPLVEQGLIPYNLSELFLPIFIKPPEKKRRIVTKSRVLTGEEILSQLEQKEEEAERKKKKQKERKERAEMRRKEVEEKKNKKRKATTKKATKRKQKVS